MCMLHTWQMKPMAGLHILTIVAEYERHITFDDVAADRPLDIQRCKQAMPSADEATPHTDQLEK